VEARNQNKKLIVFKKKVDTIATQTNQREE